MTRRSRHRRSTETPRRLLTDGGEAPDTDDESDEEGAGGSDTETAESEPDADATDTDPEPEMPDEQGGPLDRSNVEVSGAGETEPADPKWEKPDPDEIPEFEVRADDPMTRSRGGGKSAAPTDHQDDPTEGMPNTARSPGDSRIRREGTEGFVAALELCARLPEDVRLPEQAADLVPAAVEAELEQDVQSFAAAEFDNPSPHVEVLEFVERDGDIWLRLRLGVPPEAFEDLDPEEIRSHALQELEGIL